MSTASYLLCNILGKQTDPNWKPDPVTVAMIAETLATAEERGRRMGVEEAARFCDQRLGENFGDRIRAIAPRDSAPRRHKCMRCGDEFECTAPGCVAKYNVLPTMIRSGVVVEHECKSRYPRQANNPSPSQNE